MAGFSMDDGPRGRGGRRPGQGGGRPGKPTPDKARAPYNFVPLSSRVVFPDYAERVSQDVPFSDGVCGSLDLRLEARTPVFVRGGADPTAFHRVPGGLFGIPGTSLKGMLRSVVEVASFAKMGRVNDHRYGIRDLHNRELYGKHMAEISGGTIVPLVSAGWLRLASDPRDEYEEDEGQGQRRWVIEPCNFAKFEYAMLEELARERGVRGFNPGRKQSAPAKYRSWGNADRTLDCQVKVLASDGARSKAGVPRRGIFGKVLRSGEPGGGMVRGAELVFTGQPSEYRANAPKRPGAGNPKHHDFVFYGDAGEPIAVPWTRRKEFSFVHSNGGEQHRLDSDPNPEWDYMRRRLLDGGRVPVFYLQEANGTDLRAFGLAMMFRLAYRRSVLDAVRASQPECKDERHDLPQLIFGRVPGAPGRDGGTDALKGRVAIETAVAEGSPSPMKPVTGVLGAPRASYYPNYLVQGGIPGGSPQRGMDGNPRYTTYQDDAPRVRGWKRYPQREETASLPELPRDRAGKVNEKVGSTFCPLPAGTAFTTRVNVHNLRPHELGALLWAVDFGGRRECRHGLGMGKPFGYGGVSLEITGADLTPNKDGADHADLDAARRAFVAYMERELGGKWEDSEQICQLLEMARPRPPQEAADLRHMHISHPEWRNEFQGVKLAGRALPAAASLTQLREHQRVVRENRPEEPAAAALSDEQQHDDPCAAALALAEQARKTGKHLALFKTWMEEEGELEDARRQAARKVMGKPSKKWKQSRAELWRWITGG